MQYLGKLCYGIIKDDSSVSGLPKNTLYLSNLMPRTIEISALINFLALTKKRRIVPRLRISPKFNPLPGPCLTTRDEPATLISMEIAVTIDSEILNKAMQVANGQTQQELVENALRLFVMQNKQGEARKYRGKLQWEGDLDELRTAKWSL